MTYGNLSNVTPATFSPLLNTRGRPIKFTLERFQQIRNLVERGTSREEIATILDVTVGSLQVTCSKVGISLRRPKLDTSSARRGDATPFLVRTRLSFITTKEVCRRNHQIIQPQPRSRSKSR